MEFAKRRGIFLNVEERLQAYEFSVCVRLATPPFLGVNDSLDAFVVSACPCPGGMTTKITDTFGACASKNEITFLPASKNRENFLSTFFCQ